MSSEPSISISQVFKTLIFALRNRPKEGSDGLIPVLKSLYGALVHLSLTVNSDVVELRDEDLCDLAVLLFDELSAKLLFAFDVPEDQDAVQSELCSETVEELLLLLRCCMVVLDFLDCDELLLMEKSQFLVALLHVLCQQDILYAEKKRSVRARKSRLLQNVKGNSNATSSYEDLLCRMVEVFIDEPSAHRHLGKYIVMSDPVLSTRKILFGHVSIGGVLEVLSVHFLISVSREQAFEDFIETLIWSRHKNLSVPELSLTSAVTLLVNPIMVSAPAFLLAHLISLVSEVIVNNLSDPRFMSSYLLALENSIILYERHLMKLQMDDVIGRPVLSDNHVHLSLESYISPGTWEKVNLICTELDNLQGSQGSTVFTETKSIGKSNCLTFATAFVTENLFLIDEACRDEAFSLLCSLLMKARFSDIMTQRIGQISLSDFCLLGSILKLMSRSILQAVHCVKRRDLSLLGSLKGVILPRDFKLMFVHFSHLLAFSVVSEIIHLMKGCLFVMMVLMKLFVFEEGNLDFLRPLLGLEKDELGSSVSGFTDNCPIDKSIGLVRRDRRRSKCSRKVALKFHNTRKFYSSVEKRPQRACNGEAFLRLVEGLSESDIASLADFIECDRDKDYSLWLNDRKRYRAQRYAKTARKRLECRLKMWRSVDRHPRKPK